MVAHVTPPLPLRTTTARVEGTVMVLGGSHDQCAMIRTIRQKGLRALVVDRDPKAVGFALADEYAVVSTRDVDALVALGSKRSGRQPLRGVTTMGSDIPDVLAAVGSALGLPAVTQATAALATDKLRMKDTLRAAGIPVPFYGEIRSAAELVRIARARDFEVVVKPVDAAGSRGVFHPRPGDDLGALFAQSRAASRTRRVMVEEFLPGAQVSTESFLYDERAWTTGMARRNYDDALRFRPQIMENGGEQPGALGEPVEAACAALTIKAARALGIERGVAKGDLVIHPERGPMVIEIAARLSGGHFSDGLVPVATGVNILDAVVDLAVGCEPDPSSLAPSHHRSAVLRYFFPPAGRLQRIEGWRAAASLPWLRILEFFSQPGEVLSAPHHHGARAGCLLVEAGDLEKALARADEVLERVRFVTGPHAPGAAANVQAYTNGAQARAAVADL